MNRNQKNGIIRIVAVLLSLLLMISTLAGAESSGKTGNAVASSNLIITAPGADNESGISNVEQVEMEGYMSKKFVTDDVDTLNDNNYQMAVVMFASDYMAETKDDENQFPVSFENKSFVERKGKTYASIFYTADLTKRLIIMLDTESKCMTYSIETVSTLDQINLQYNQKDQWTMMFHPDYVKENDGSTLKSWAYSILSLFVPEYNKMHNVLVQMGKLYD